MCNQQQRNSPSYANGLPAQFIVFDAVKLRHCIRIGKYTDSIFEPYSMLSFVALRLGLISLEPDHDFLSITPEM